MSQDYDPNARIVTLAQSIAGHLGEGWTIDTARSYPHGATIVGPDDVGLYLRDEDFGRGWLMGKVHITPAYRRDAIDVAYDVKSPRIIVSGTRKPEALAKDIARRILPEVTTETARLVAAVASHRAASKQRHAARDQLVALLPHARVDDERWQDTRTTIKLNTADSTSYGEVTLAYEGNHVSRMTINSLPLDKALRIAAILAEA